MNENAKEFERVIVKQRTTNYVGVERVTYNRNAIGMVLSGTKYIHQGDNSIKIKRGEIFFLAHGSHQIEDAPESKAPFEQIAIYYTAEQLQHALSLFDDTILNRVEMFDIDNVDSTDMVTVAKPTRIVRNLFMSINTQHEAMGFLDDKLSEKLKLAELAHLIMRYEDDGILRSFASSIDSERAKFEQIIYANTFADKSITELAEETSRSVTTFKKYFNCIFGTPPHQWFQQQRLEYARLLLSTTNQSVAQIGESCSFPNASHFIKIFKRTFDVTPAVFREKCRNKDKK